MNFDNTQKLLEDAQQKLASAKSHADASLENQAKELLAQERSKHTEANAAVLGGQTVVQTEDQLVTKPGDMPFENVSIDSNMAGNGADPLALKDGSGIINEGAQGETGVGDAGGAGGKASAGMEQMTIYSANGDPALRNLRRPAFDSMLNDGFEIDGNQYKLNRHAYNALFKSQRKNIMPADIFDALKGEPIPGNPGSLKHVNPITGTKVFINPVTKEIIGVWPAGFKE